MIFLFINILLRYRASRSLAENIMREEYEEYFEEEQEPEKCLIKGILLSPFVLVASVIISAAGLVSAVIATIVSFFVALFRLSFDFSIAGKYALSALDKCATLAVAAICSMWYSAFHKNA